MVLQQNGPVAGSMDVGQLGALADRTVDIGPVLDQAEWSAFQKRILFLVSLTIVLDGLDTQTMTLAIPTLIREWGITRAPFGIVLAFGYVAMAVGTIVGGLIGDRMGRRAALLASVTIFGFGTLLGAFTNDITMLGLTRMLASVGLGAAMPNATAMAAEYTPLRQRSMAMGIALGSVPLGAFGGGMLAAYILPHGTWQDLFVVCGTIPLAGAVLLAALLPESIRFLVGRPGSAPKIATLLGKVGYSATSGDRFVDTAESHAERPRVGQLFAPAHRCDTMILSMAFFLVIFANLFVVSWTPSLLADLGYRPGLTSTAIATWSVGGMVGAIVGAVLFARSGSRRAMALMVGGAVVIALVLAFTPLGPNGVGAGGLTTLLLIGGILVPGSQVMLFALAGQLYATTIRATGVGFSAAVGRIGAVLSGLAGPFILPTGGSFGFFATVAAAMLVSGVLLQFTKGEVRATREGGEQSKVPLAIH